MAKQYRTKLKSIYGGRSAAGRNEYKPDDILKGQHLSNTVKHSSPSVVRVALRRCPNMRMSVICLVGIILAHRLGQSTVIIMMCVQRLLLQAHSMIKPLTLKSLPISKVASVLSLPPTKKYMDSH